jgi:hypothetical protein
VWYSRSLILTACRVMYSSAYFKCAATVSLRPLCGFSAAYRVVGVGRARAMTAQKCMAATPTADFNRHHRITSIMPSRGRIRDQSILAHSTLPPDRSPDQSLGNSDPTSGTKNGQPREPPVADSKVRSILLFRCVMIRVPRP